MRESEKITANERRLTWANEYNFSFSPMKHPIVAIKGFHASMMKLVSQSNKTSNSISAFQSHSTARWIFSVTLFTSVIILAADLAIDPCSSSTYMHSRRFAFVCSSFYTSVIKNIIIRIANRDPTIALLEHLQAIFIHYHTPGVHQNNI